jgi:hypothetical protein
VGRAPGRGAFQGYLIGMLLVDTTRSTLAPGWLDASINAAGAMVVSGRMAPRTGHGPHGSRYRTVDASATFRPATTLPLQRGQRVLAFLRHIGPLRMADGLAYPSVASAAQKNSCAWAAAHQVQATWPVSPCRYRSAQERPAVPAVRTVAGRLEHRARHGRRVRRRGRPLTAALLRAGSSLVAPGVEERHLRGYVLPRTRGGRRVPVHVLWFAAYHRRR